MPFVLADRVKDSTTSPGTGQVTLANVAATGYQTFGSAVADGDTFYYCIADQSGVNWEVGYGSYTASGTKLNRLAILASSNAGAAVNFAAGTQDVFLTCPASAIADRATSRTIPTIATDFLGGATVTAGPPSIPWTVAVWGSGTIAHTSAANHPGICRCSSSSTNPSGVSFMTSSNNGQDIYLAGGEGSEFIIRPVTLTNQTARYGWFLANAGGAASNGIWLEMATTGATTLNAANASTTTTSSSLYTMVTNTWYRLRIDVAYDYTSATGIIYNASGSILGTQTVSTNLPTNPVAHGFQTNNAGTNIGALVDVDWMTAEWNKPIPR